MIRWFRSIIVLALVTSLVSVGPAALAAWNKTSDGHGHSRAISMPSGSTPWTSVSNRTVVVSWSAVTMPGGIPVDGYRVFRYDAGGSAIPVTGGCAGVIAALDCTETAMAPGSWRYSVAPVYKSWQGAEGSLSSAAVVAAPALNLSGSTNVTSFPATLSGTVNNYIPGQTLTMRLNDPTNGLVLAATVTPSSIPADGQATIQVTVPSSVADGGHTLYAVGSGGDVAAASFNVGVPSPQPSLLIPNVGVAGRPERGDRVEVTFSEPLSVSSLCSAWSNDNADQQITGNGVVTVQIANNQPGGNDVLTVTANACGAQGFKFGSIDLGSPNFVTATRTFEGNGGPNRSVVDYSAGQQKLVITLGAASGGVGTVSQAVTATYTPDPSIAGTNGRLVSGSASTSAVHF
ncbi:MAG: hypothetical protein ACRDJL_03840 [Actinomycetota bacterium]